MPRVHNQYITHGSSLMALRNLTKNEEIPNFPKYAQEVAIPLGE